MMRLSDETRPASTKASSKPAEGGEQIRLYVKGTVVGYRRYVESRESARTF